MTPHTYHAVACEVRVPPRMLMCRKHWYMVSPATRDLVWATYRPGQELDKQPTRQYLEAAKQAIGEVAAKEGRAPHA